jgi:hypothetical protein
MNDRADLDRTAVIRWRVPFRKFFRLLLVVSKQLLFHFDLRIDDLDLATEFVEEFS